MTLPDTAISDVLGHMVVGIIIGDVAGRPWRMSSAAVRMHRNPVAGIPSEDWSRSCDLPRVDGIPNRSEVLPLARVLTRGEIVEGGGLRQTWRPERR